MAVYRDYLAHLSASETWDFRSIHSLLADRIAAGDLPGVLNGAPRLHMYGVSSLRHRRRLMEALAAQPDVEVVLYLLEEPEEGEWGPLVDSESVGTAAAQVPVVQPAPDEQRELEYVASEIKRRVLAGTPPDEIAVVARMGRMDARLAHETLEQAGIPTTARIRTTLAEVPALKAVLHLLRGAARDWPWRPLRQVLENSCFDLDDIDLRAIDQVATEQRLTGLEGWTAVLEQRRPAPDEDAEAEDVRLQRWQRSMTRFREFAAQVSRLSDARPLRDWIAITRDMLDPGWFALREQVCRAPGDRWDVVRLDQQGIEKTCALLAQWEESADAVELLDAKAWYTAFRRFLGSNELALSTPRRTGVQVLEAHEAALVPFRHTFLIHANDGEFPRQASPSWLFSDDEIGALRKAGLPLADRALELRRERALWRAVTSGPEVTITYRTADAGGTPLLPSLMVPEHDEASEIPRTTFVWEEPFTAHQADRCAVRDLGAQVSLDGSVKVPRVEPVRLAVLHAVAESHRLGSADGARPAGLPGPWNGHIRDPEVLEYLAGHFGNDRLWSASQLESYAQNPFMYLVQRVMHIDERREAEEDANVMTQGSVIHTLLERFYGSYPGPFPGAWDAGTAERFDTLTREVLAELEAGQEWLGLPSLWQVRREKLCSVVAEYLAWELERFSGSQPVGCEFGFGEDPVVIIRGTDSTGRQASMRLRGKIDRIDAAGDALTVVDYKSGQAPKAAGYDDGSVLQGPLYMAALRVLGREAVSAEYRTVKKPARASAIDWVDHRAQYAVRLALSIPARIRAGLFEPCAAKGGGWKRWWPGGPALYRCESIHEGCRFDD